MHDALVVLSHSATTAGSCQWVACAINHISSEHLNLTTFSTQAMHDALVRLSRFATTASSVIATCRVICNLSSVTATRRNLRSTAMRDALEDMRPFATSAASRNEFNRAVVFVTEESEADDSEESDDV
jgi:hypothetical protein